MTHEQFEHEKDYRAALSIAKAMLEKGFIDEKDYAKIDTILKKKYLPILGGILG